MKDDDPLDRIEKVLSDLRLRVERLESAEREHDSRHLASKVERVEPATTSELPSDAPSGHPPTADEATPTVPSAVSFSSPESAETNPPPEDSSPLAPPPPPRTTLPPPAGSATIPKQSADIEKVLGTRVTAIVGGLLVVAAAAFFAKMAFDRGWIGAVPPLVRALLLAGFGGSMLVSADVLRRRIGNPAAVGLAMAGIGTLYVDGWAIGPVLELAGSVGSLVAMAAAAAIGLFFTARFGSRMVGAASLVAAVAAPYLAGGDGGHVAAGGYFSIVFFVAFFASVIQPRPFLGMRWISFSILIFGATPWLLVAISDSAWDVVLATTTCWWFLVHASSIQSAHRGFDWETGAGLGIASTALIAIPVPLAMRGFSAGSIEGWVPLGLAALCVAFAFQCGVGLGAFRPSASNARRRERCMHALAMTAWLEGLTLAMVSVALLIPVFGIPVAWGGTALALGFHARRFGGRGTAIFAGMLVIASQFAASIITLINWGGPDWFQGTPFEMEPVPEAITILFAWVTSLMLAAIWPNLGTPKPGQQGPPPTIWPGMLLTLGILPVLIPALFIGDMGWWIPVAAAPFIGGSLVAVWRREHSNHDILFVMRALGLCGLIVAFVIGTGTTIDSGDRSYAIVLVAYAIPMVGLLMIDMVRSDRQGNERSLQGDAVASLLIAMVSSGASITLLVGELDSVRAGIDAVAIGSIGLGLGPLLLGLVRWRGSLIVRPAIPVGISCLAVLVWIVGVFNLMTNQKSFIEDGGRFHTWVWSGLILLGITSFQSLRGSKRRERPEEWRKTSSALALFMGLSTGSIWLYALLGPGTFAAVAGLSIWWALYAIGLVGVGFLKGISLIRHCGLGLLGVTAVKFLAVDMSESSAEFRVISALGIGLLMVGTSIIYARFGRGIGERAVEDHAGEPSTTDDHPRSPDQNSSTLPSDIGNTRRL